MQPVPALATNRRNVVFTFIMQKYAFITLAGFMLSSYGESACAIEDFAFQPRLEAGAMFYELDVGDFSRTETTGGGPTAGLPTSTITSSIRSESGLKFNSWMPFIGGGGTFFFNRLFVDVNAQYADNGSGIADTTFFNTVQEPIEGAADIGLPSDRLFTEYILQNNRSEADFDRTEWAVSVGYAIAGNFALYAGYKSAQTDFKMNRSGTLRQDVCGNFSGIDPAVGIPADTSCQTFQNETFTDNTKLEFKNDGPFVGGTFGWDIRKGLLDGTIVGNFAVAFLKGEIRETNFNIVRTPVVGGSDERFSEAPRTTVREGDTIGLSVGLVWRGSTRIKSLTYIIGVDGYQYNFSDERAGDFTEKILRVKAGAAYLF